MKSKTSKFKALTNLSCATVALVYAGVANAQDVQNIRFDIPAKDLSTALSDFALQGNQQVLFSPELVAGKEGNVVVGELSMLEAFEMLIEGQGLQYEVSSNGALLISAKVDQQEGGVLPPKQSEAATQTISAPVSVEVEPTVAEENETPLPMDAVVVTGSNISRSALDSTIPLKLLDADYIESVGSVDLGEILEELPGVGLEVSPDNTLTNTQNAGVSAVALRNLESNRTLTLIDGRRAVSNSGNTQRVNLATIPAGFIKRTEISTGGASAVYGSDAIAGVVNIILNDDFEGLKANTRYGEAFSGGEEEFTIDLTAGTRFANDRGHVMLGVSYDKEGEIEAIQRDDALRPIRFNDGEFDVNLSTFLPGGRFESDDAWFANGRWFNDMSLAPDDGRVPSVGFETAIDGYNFRPDYSLSPSEERLVLGVKSDFEFSSVVKAFADIQYAALETSSVNGYQNASNTTDFGLPGEEEDIGSISSSHPFIPDAVEETRSGSVSWRRRFVEVGRDSRKSDRDTLRVWTGLEGALSNDWEWSTWIGYGKFKQRQVRRNELNFQHIQFALDIEGDGNGGFQCSSADARALGCVPLDIFGEGAITPQAADYIRATATLDQENTQTTFAARLTGDAFELPAGPVRFATGVDYRREEQKTDGDDLVNTGVTGFAAISDLKGQYDVSEAFLEFDVPLIADKPGVRKLNLDTAIRVGEYDTIGSVSAWKVGGVWAIDDSFRFRGQVSTAQRAPDISELFSGVRGDFDTASDPCDGVTASSTGVVATNCLSNPGVAAVVAAEGVFEENGTQVFAPNSGNRNLKEETSLTQTFGFVYTPTYIEGLAVTVDYYSIKLEDAIDSVDTQIVLDLCYNSVSFDNRFCDVISRNAEGEISQVINQEENLNEINSKGIDATISYDFDLSSIPGKFDGEFIYSYIDTLDEVFIGEGGVLETEDKVGEIGDSEHQWRFAFGWKNDGVRLRWKTRFIGSAVDDNTAAPGDDGFFEVDDWYRHDIYASYAPDELKNVVLYAGVNNLFDDLGPLTPTGLDNGRSRNLNSNYDVVGRYGYLGVKYTF